MPVAFEAKISAQGLSWSDLLKEERKQVRVALEKSKDEYVKTAKNQVPVDTGELRDQITAFPNKKRTSWLVIVMGRDTDEVIKAQAVEHGRSADTRGGFMRAYRYFLDTSLFYGEKHRRRINRAMNQAVKAAVARNGIQFDFKSRKTISGSRL